jgi:hypothetical protein
MLQEVKFLDYNTYLMVMSTVFCEKAGAVFTAPAVNGQ